MPPPTHIANRLNNRQKKGKQRTTIKCVQLNAQHSRAATSNLTQIIIYNNIDIAFVQETYTFHNKVAGYPKVLRIFAQGGGKARAAIIVNNDMVVTAITQVSNEDAIVTEIRYKGTKLFATSLYLPRDRDLETMEEITQLSRGNGLILAIDSNARSRLWFDKRSNKRGRAIEELIIDRDLIIIKNEESDTPHSKPAGDTAVLT